jgi:hypothetical protein
MSFFRKLGSFWIFIILFAVGAYFCALNLDYVDVNVPWLDTFRVRAATAYVLCFILGCLLTMVYFGFDAFRKTLLIRKQEKLIKRLEKDLKASNLSTEYLSGHEEPGEADGLGPRLQQSDWGRNPPSKPAL